MDDEHRFQEKNILSWLGLKDDQRDVLVLNVLLLGDRQSGRSSVRNALIGQSFKTAVPDLQAGPGSIGATALEKIRIYRISALFMSRV